jgi:CRP-like cAMP-binding protein
MLDRSSQLPGLIDWNAVGASKNIQAWHALLPFGTPECYAAKATVFRQGSNAIDAFLLTGGLVKLVATTACGRETIVGLRFPGQWVQASALALQVRHIVSAVAITECGMKKIDANRFLVVLRSDERAAGLFVENMAVDLHNLGINLMESKVLDAEQRLERLLTTLAVALGKESVDGRALRVRLPFSDLEIAELLGISAQHLSTLKVALQKTQKVRWVDKRLVELSNARSIAS